MPTDRCIYLDNGATSWPKPPAVVEAIGRFYRELGTAAGRGTSSRASQVDRTVEICRAELAALINAGPNQIVFCFNGTDGLNLTLNGLIRQGDHVVTTEVEHNSTLRPLNHQAKFHQVKLDIVRCVGGEVDYEQLRSIVTASTRLVSVSHVSNVTGIVQDIELISKICRETDTLLVVDAAQSVGHVPVDFKQLSCDALVAAGHKGLLGPLGTGFVCLSSKAASEIEPTRLGGTGTNSDSMEQPKHLPYRLESGNLNVGGIFGLLEGVRFLAGQQIDNVVSHEFNLGERLRAELSQIETVEMYGSHHSRRTGIVCFNLIDQDPQSLTALLDSEFGIHCRAGLHCAPLMHKSLGTFDRGGTVRFSPGVFTKPEEVEFAAKAVAEIASQLV